MPYQDPWSALAAGMIGGQQAWEERRRYGAEQALRERELEATDAYRQAQLALGQQQLAQTSEHQQALLAMQQAQEASRVEDRALAAATQAGLSRALGLVGGPGTAGLPQLRPSHHELEGFGQPAPSLGQPGARPLTWEEFVARGLEEGVPPETLMALGQTVTDQYKQWETSQQWEATRATQAQQHQDKLALETREVNARVEQANANVRSILQTQADKTTYEKWVGEGGLTKLMEAIRARAPFKEIAELVATAPPAAQAALLQMVLTPHQIALQDLDVETKTIELDKARAERDVDKPGWYFNRFLGRPQWMTSAQATETDIAYEKAERLWAPEVKVEGARGEVAFPVRPAGALPVLPGLSEMPPGGLPPPGLGGAAPARVDLNALAAQIGYGEPSRADVAAAAKAKADAAKAAAKVEADVKAAAKAFFDYTGKNFTIVPELRKGFGGLPVSGIPENAARDSNGVPLRTTTGGYYVGRDGRTPDPGDVDRLFQLAADGRIYAPQAAPAQAVPTLREAYTKAGNKATMAVSVKAVQDCKKGGKPMDATIQEAVNSDLPLPPEIQPVVNKQPDRSLAAGTAWVAIVDGVYNGLSGPELLRHVIARVFAAGDVSRKHVGRGAPAPARRTPARPALAPQPGLPSHTTLQDVLRGPLGPLGAFSPLAAAPPAQPTPQAQLAPGPQLPPWLVSRLAPWLRPWPTPRAQPTPSPTSPWGLTPPGW